MFNAGDLTNSLNTEDQTDHIIHGLTKNVEEDKKDAHKYAILK